MKRTEVKDLLVASIDLDLVIFEIDLALEELDPESEAAVKLEKVKASLKKNLSKINAIRNSIKRRSKHAK